LNGFDLYFFLTGFTGLIAPVKHVALFCKFNVVKIFFACGEIPLGRRPFYPDDPVNPV
jgi:hypothetical protein